MLGALNGLSQLTLKTLLPGVPDFYQGTEFWDFSLVDPDNRRPVDFAARADALTHAPDDWQTLTANWRDGRIKIALTHRLLRLRRDYAELFRRGSYEPLTVSGPQADHVIAFARTWKRQQLVVAVARHFAPLTDGGRHWPTGPNAVVEPTTPANFVDVIGTCRKRRTTELNLVHLLSEMPVCVLRRV